MYNRILALTGTSGNTQAVFEQVKEDQVARPGPFADHWTT